MSMWGTGKIGLIELIDDVDGPICGFVAPGDHDDDTFAHEMQYEFEAEVDREHIVRGWGRWLPPNPDGFHEFRRVSEPGPGAFRCTYIDRDHVRYPWD